MISSRHLRWLAVGGVLTVGAAWAQNSDESATLTVPAGTRIIARLRSPIDTTSAVSESGVYLESIEPVVIENRVAIPARCLIRGTVESGKRPGHVDRRSRLRFSFTTVIFPNNHVAAIDGVLESIPGSHYRKKDSAGTTGTVDQVEKTLPELGALAVTGALFGSVRRTGIGGILPGAGLGAALGLGKVLLRRGDEIHLPEGTRFEIGLRAPISISQRVIAENDRLVPAALNSSTAADTDEPSSLQPSRKRPSHFRMPLSPLGLPFMPFDLNEI